MVGHSMRDHGSNGPIPSRAGIGASLECTGDQSHGECKTKSKFTFSDDHRGRSAKAGSGDSAGPSRRGGMPSASDEVDEEDEGGRASSDESS